MNVPTETGAGEILASLSITMVVLIAAALTALRLVLLMLKTRKTDSPAEVHPMAKGVAEILESLIIAGVLVFLIIRPFFVQAFFIPSESMENTLQGHDSGYNQKTGSQHSDTIHDHIFVNKLVFRYSEPRRGDIIVFKAPKDADGESKSQGLEPKENILIKRLIAIPGDTFQVKKGIYIGKDGKKTPASVVYINGVPQKEDYIKEAMEENQPPGAIHGVDGPLKLLPGQLIVMGDNRNDSNDSRYWGILERDRVIGKANLIFFPFNRIRPL